MENNIISQSREQRLLCLRYFLYMYVYSVKKKMNL